MLRSNDFLGVARCARYRSGPDAWSLGFQRVEFACCSFSKCPTHRAPDGFNIIERSVHYYYFILLSSHVDIGRHDGCEREESVCTLYVAKVDFANEVVVWSDVVHKLMFQAVETKTKYVENLHFAGNDRGHHDRGR